MFPGELRVCIPGLAPRKYIEKNKGKRGTPSTEISGAQVSKCRFSLAFDNNSPHPTWARWSVTHVTASCLQCFMTTGVSTWWILRVNLRIKSCILTLALFQNYCTTNLWYTIRKILGKQRNLLNCFWCDLVSEWCPGNYAQFHRSTGNL